MEELTPQQVVDLLIGYGKKRRVSNARALKKDGKAGPELRRMFVHFRDMGKPFSDSFALVAGGWAYEAGFQDDIPKLFLSETLAEEVFFWLQAQTTP